MTLVATLTAIASMLHEPITLCATSEDAVRHKMYYKDMIVIIIKQKMSTLLQH